MSAAPGTPPERTHRVRTRSRPLLAVGAAAVLACHASLALADDGALCRTAIGGVEASQHIPDAFLSAIARVESGRLDRATGMLVPWPWTINAEGQGSFFGSEAEAIAAVRILQARGVRSIDVGCMQVNLMHHPEAFASLEQAFEPASNAAFAGQLLQSLFAQTHSWPRAAAAYHSQTPTVGAAYQQRVLAEWAVPDRADTNRPAPHVGRPGHVMSTTPPASGADMHQAATAQTAMSAGPQAGPSMGRVTAFAGRSAPNMAGLAATGRSLAAYRAMPTTLALRTPLRHG